MVGLSFLSQWVFGESDLSKRKRSMFRGKCETLLCRISGAWCPSAGHLMKVHADGWYLDLCPKGALRERDLSLGRKLPLGTTKLT